MILRSGLHRWLRTAQASSSTSGPASFSATGNTEVHVDNTVGNAHVAPDPNPAEDHVSVSDGSSLSDQHDVHVGAAEAGTAPLDDDKPISAFCNFS